MVKNKSQVSFLAKKEVSRPVKISFTTKSGASVSFNATKKTTKPVRVNFWIKDEKK